MFIEFLKSGFEHILDPNGYDHILFVVALSVIYKIADWKKILILVTAFTIGHSITLALSAFGTVRIDADLVETLIPLTILVTAVYNIFAPQGEARNINWNYLLALFFGFIHGLGYSNFFKAIMGKEERIVGPLAAFNIGLEIGQLILVLLTLILGFIVSKLLNFPHKTWRNVVSTIIAVWAIYLMLV